MTVGPDEANPRHILVVVDKPKYEQVAIARAIELRALTGARLTLAAFVWQPEVESINWLDGHGVKSVKQTLCDERRAWLEGQVKKTGADQKGIRTEVVWTDDIAGWVGKQASSGKFDLVLKTVHLTRTFFHTPLDWRILRECHQPVLLTRSMRRRRNKNALATIDLRRLDRKHRAMNTAVLDAARHYASLTGGELHVASVVEVPEVLKDLDLVNPRDVRRRMLSDNREALEKLLKNYNLPSRQVHVKAGKAGQTIAQIARECRADVLVVGSTVHRIQQTIGLGNTAERIISRAPCDLLVVHP